MKILSIILILTFVTLQISAQQNIGLGTSSPDLSSILDINSTTRGILIPRMLASQRSVVVSPATGLIVFQTDSPVGLYINTGTPSTPFWEHISTSATSWRLTGNSGTNSGTTFIGTTDDEPLVFKVNGEKAGNIDSGSPHNTSFRYQSLNSNTGNFNSAFGGQALYSNVSGSFNTANGRGALYSNMTGDNNTAHGYFALNRNSTGEDNTAIGNRALYANTSGSGNTANGYRALYNNTTGFSNIAIGTGALYSNTTTSNLVAVGDSALYYNGLNGNGSGKENTAIGSKALYSNTTASFNTASGSGALYSNTGGSNTANGQNALFGNTVGDNNTATGRVSLAYNTSGNYNTACGYGSLLLNETGQYNSAFGGSAYFDVVSLNNTTCIGYTAGGIVDASNRIEIGNTSITSIAGEVSFTTYSDGRIKDNIREDVPGISFINKLRPVTYNLNIHRQNAMVYQNSDKLAAEWAGKYDIEKMKMSGFIAQEVESAATELGYDFSGIDAPANPQDLYGLRYSEFVVPLVKAVQELSQNNNELFSINQELTAKNQAQDVIIENLVERLEKLENEGRER